jgi:hypothetical protein
MSHRFQALRSRPGRAVAAALFVATGGVLLLASPASAHTATVQGKSSCPDVNHVVSWTLRNHETLPSRPMTIESVTAVLNGKTYAVTGYETVVPAGEATHAQTIVPGDLTGVITLTMHAVWPDGFKATASGNVELQAPCVTGATSPKPTTPVPTTPVPKVPPGGGTPGASNATAPPTTVGAVQGIEVGATTSTAPQSALPFTGAHSDAYAFVGALALVLGAALLVSTTRRRGEDVSA